jgi:hypothetical protein
MTLPLKICLYILLGLTVYRLSADLWTVTKQVRAWYLTQPSFTVMGMAEGMSEAEVQD